MKELGGYFQTGESLSNLCNLKIFIYFFFYQSTMLVYQCQLLWQYLQKKQRLPVSRSPVAHQNSIIPIIRRLRVQSMQDNNADRHSSFVLLWAK